MSEIAEELERMAEEFDGTRLLYRADAEMPFDPDDNPVVMAFAYEKVVKRLRARAAELRAQRSGPTYKPQPKPSEVRAGQWWALRRMRGEVDAPGRVEKVDAYRIYMRTELGLPWDAPLVNQLTSDRWLYLGDGPEPAR